MILRSLAGCLCILTIQIKSFSQEPLFKESELTVTNSGDLLQALNKIEKGLWSSPLDDNKQLADTIKEMCAFGKEKAADEMLRAAQVQKGYVERYGEFKGVEKLGATKIGNSIVTAGYFWKTKNAALIYMFLFYNNGDNKWKLTSFNLFETMSTIDNTNRLNHIITNLPTELDSPPNK